MARKFRFTCARTTYFEVELEAEDCGGAEERLIAALAENPALCDGATSIGKPIYRIVEAAGAEEQRTGERHAEAA